MNITCPSCSKRISELATHCPYCRAEIPGGGEQAKKAKARPGWYPQESRPGELRRWDGAKWLDEWKPAKAARSRWTGGDYLAAALVALLIGAILTVPAYLIDEAFGVIVASAAGLVVSVFLSIGIVAKGVEAGVRGSRL